MRQHAERMKKIRGFSLISVLAIGAFLWGYKRDEIIAYWDGLFTEETATEEEVTPTPDDSNKSTPTPTIATVGNNTGSSSGDPHDFYKSLRPKNTPQPSAKPKPSPTFRETMQSIQPAKVEDRKKTKRNLYFDKLRKELKALQGEKPPETETETEVMDGEQSEESPPSTREESRVPSPQPPRLRPPQRTPQSVDERIDEPIEDEPLPPEEILEEENEPEYIEEIIPEEFIDTEGGLVDELL